MLPDRGQSEDIVVIRLSEIHAVMMTRIFYIVARIEVDR